MPEAKIAAEEIKKLLERIAELRKTIASAGEPGRAQLDVIEPGLRGIQQELGTDAEGKVEVGAWERMSEPLRRSLYQRLQTTAQTLERIAAGESDGQPDPNSIMFRRHASNPWIVGLTLAGILFTVVVLSAVFQHWDTATRVKPEVKTAEGNVVELAQSPTEKQVLGMIILMGALGGCLHWTSSLAMFIGNAQLLRRWIPYYLMMPFEGAALAPVIYLLFRVGVLSPQAANAGTAQLNLISLYAFAGLTGLFAKQAIEMLADVFTVIFKKIQAKDSIEDKKANQGRGQSSSGASGGGKTP